jgi:hypothetical protein
MTTRKTSCKSPTSAPRKTKRGGNQNVKSSTVSHFAAAMLPPRCSELLSRLCQKLWRRLRLRRRSRSLRVCDVASLGEKRFVAVVQYGSRRFLVGGGAGSVSLLSQLGRDDSPAEPLYTGREVRGNVPFLPLIPTAAAAASPFDAEIAESPAGARLAV